MKLRRYGNRKLYDVVAHRFVSLDDIAKAIARGEEVAAIENDSGADCTSRVLAQVLLHETESGRARPAESILAILRESPVAQPRSGPTTKSIRDLLRADTDAVLRKPRSS